jgi:hypothetical protein
MWIKHGRNGVIKIHLNLTKVQIITGAVAIIVIAAGVASLFIIRKNQLANKAATPVKVCSEDTIKKASSAIKTNDKASLSAIESEIIRLKDYQRDQSCLYVTVWSALSVGEIKKAEGYLVSLKKVYKDGGYSKAFAISTYSYPELVQLADDAKEARAIDEKEEAQRLDEESRQLNEIDKRAESGQRR